MIVDLECNLRRALDRRKTRSFVVPGNGPKCVSCGRETTIRAWLLGFKDHLSRKQKLGLVKISKGASTTNGCGRRSDSLHGSGRTILMPIGFDLSHLDCVIWSESPPSKAPTCRPKQPKHLQVDRIADIPKGAAVCIWVMVFMVRRVACNPRRADSTSLTTDSQVGNHV